MTGRNDSDYFTQRERSERAAAKQAASPQARRVHQELAQEYAERARRGESNSSRPVDGTCDIQGTRSRLTIIAPSAR